MTLQNTITHDILYCHRTTQERNSQRKWLKGSTVMPERHVHTELNTSTEFCSQQRNNLDYSTSTHTKWNLEQTGICYCDCTATLT